MMLKITRRRSLAPGALVVAAFSATAAVVGVAAIDASPNGDDPVREIFSQALAVAPVAVMDGEAAPLLTTDVVRAGETVYSLVSRAGVVDAEAIRVIRSSAELALLRQMAPGGRLTVGRDEEGLLHTLDYLAPDFRRVRVARDGDAFKIESERVKPEIRIAMRAGDVGRSMFHALRTYAVPDEIQRQLVAVFSKQFDLHKAAQEIERFAVAYEEITLDGAVVRLGRVLATEMVRDGRTYRAVWFADGKGGRYYTPDGATLDRTFLPSPVEYTQVTSWFGVERQLRWNPGAEHKGIDYAAPIGTPVKAAGDGVVEFIGTQRGYGNVVILKHREPITTLYAHLDSFAEGLKQGDRVMQGELIGNVGRTGWATGPHLHYEFRVNGEPQEPRFDAVPAEELASSTAMERFRTHAASLVHLLERMSGVRIAAAN
jgi:murein DD-endopeptidase MepM/ murein hydrolase activator NlpD